MRTPRRHWLFPKESPSPQDNLNSTPGFRDARFCISLPCGWHSGTPEEIQVFLVAHLKTVWLGFSRARRTCTGTSKRGWEKPNLFTQSSPAFYYDLGNTKHIEAFLRTWRRLSAFSAALQQTPEWVSSYWEDQTTPEQLCHTILVDANYTKKNGRKAKQLGYELLTIERSEKGNLNFRIERKVRDDHKTAELKVLDAAYFFTIPNSVVPNLCAATKRLLLFYYTYATRNPEQVFKRWDLKKDKAERNTQLYFNENLWSENLIPDLETELSPLAEQALFSHPSLYERQRIHKSKGKVSLETVTPRYLARLVLFAKQKLLWRKRWRVSSYQAREDISILQKLFWKRIVATTKVRLLACLVSSCLRWIITKTRQLLPIRVLQHSLEEKLGFAELLRATARAPPQQ